MPGGKRQLKGAEQAQSEDDEHGGDESVHPGAVAELHHAERVRQWPSTSAPRPVKRTMMPRQKTTAWSTPSLLAARLAIQEVRNRERDHGEHAGGEDGGESRAECGQQETGQKPEAGCGGGAAGAAEAVATRRGARLAPRYSRQESRWPRLSPTDRSRWSPWPSCAWAAGKWCRCRTGSARWR